MWITALLSMVAHLGIPDLGLRERAEWRLFKGGCLDFPYMLYENED